MDAIVFHIPLFALLLVVFSRLSLADLEDRLTSFSNRVTEETQAMHVCRHVCVDLILLRYRMGNVSTILLVMTIASELLRFAVSDGIPKVVCLSVLMLAALAFFCAERILFLYQERVIFLLEYLYADNMFYKDMFFLSRRYQTIRYILRMAAIALILLFFLVSFLDVIKGFIG